MGTKKTKITTIADPFESFDPEAETTSFILHEATKRQYESWICEPKDLFVLNGKVFAWAKKVIVTKNKKRFSYEVIDEGKVSLNQMPCIFLRKDPPVDEAYINHLTILELLERKNGPLFINSPSGIKRANEKVYTLNFPGMGPPTLVSASERELKNFLKKYKKVVLKPLNAAGGKGIFLVREDDPNRSSILETATKNYTGFVMLQKYIPEAKKGDKRILLLSGEPVGSFLRIPSKDDFRGNMHSGAKWVRSRITNHEKQMIQQIKPRLLADGLVFVGLDIIGRFITEINLTSPMGIREVNHFENSHIEKMVLNCLPDVNYLTP